MHEEEKYFELPEEGKDEEKIRPKSRGRRIFELTFGILAILGMLYLSGFYQYLFYFKTSNEATEISLGEIEEYDGETLAVPVNIFIVKGGGDLNSYRDEKNAEITLDKANKIWKQAGVEFSISDIDIVSVPDAKEDVYRADPSRLILDINPETASSIDVYFVNHISGINGLAYSGLRSVLVADFTTVPDFRVLAHEMGHILGLGHVEDPRSRLMFKESNGAKLTPEEIEKARAGALLLKGGTE